MNVYVVISDGDVVVEAEDFNKAHKEYESICYGNDVPTVELREYTYETKDDYLLGDDPSDTEVLYTRTGCYDSEDEDGTDDI